MNFDNIKFWTERIFSLFDIKGGVIIGLFSLEVLALIPYCIITGREFPLYVRDIYLGVIAAFAGTNIARHFGGKNEPQK